jgi:hypothetical protein
VRSNGSGRSVARLARLLGVQEVESSNLSAPTIFKGVFKVLTLFYLSSISRQMKVHPLNNVTEIKRNGISVRIRPTIKNDTTYFVLDYRASGKRKLVWRSTMTEARKAADVAIDKITDGQTEVLNLRAADAHAFTRARAILNGGNGETKIDWR